MLKERRWELMEVDEQFGPVEIVVTEELVDQFSEAVDDFATPHGGQTPRSSRVAHPTLLCKEARDVIRTAYDLASGGAGMHTKHSCSIHACPRLGESVVITGTHVEKYLKRDKQYIVLESVVRGSNGRLVLSQRSTHLRALRPGVAKAPSERAGAAKSGVGDPAGESGKCTNEPSRRLMPLTKRPSQPQLTLFANDDWKNIHNSPEVAHAAGLRGCIASGLQTMAYVSEMMEAYLAEGWRSGGQLDVAFTAPLAVDTSVRVDARPVRVDQVAGERRVVCEVWVDTLEGVRVLAGQASGRLLD